MPTNYAGSTWIGSSPVRDFRDVDNDQYTEDERMQEWALKKGIIKPKGVEGSTFTQTEAADPSRGFLGAFTARKNSVAEDKPINGKEYMKTEDRWIEPKLNKRQARSFKDQFDEDMAKRELENERLRREAENATKEKQKSDQRVAEARAMGKLGVELEGEKRVMANDPKLQSPVEAEAKTRADLNKSLAQQATKVITVEDLRLTEAEDRRKELAKKVNDAVLGRDIPDISKNGEMEIRRTKLSGATPEQAMAAGERKHQEDVARIKQLEAIGTPESLREADIMRASDPDLNREARIPVLRDRAGERENINRNLKSFKTMGDTAMNAEDASLDFWNADDWRSGGNDRIADLDEHEVQPLIQFISEAANNIKLEAPRMTDQEIRQSIESWLKTNFSSNPDDISILMRGVM